MDINDTLCNAVFIAVGASKTPQTASAIYDRIDGCDRLEDVIGALRTLVAANRVIRYGEAGGFTYVTVDQCEISPVPNREPESTPDGGGAADPVDITGPSPEVPVDTGELSRRNRKLGDQVVAYLAANPHTRSSAIAAAIGHPANPVRSALWRLHKAGVITRGAGGAYRLAEDIPAPPASAPAPAMVAIPHSVAAPASFGVFDDGRLVIQAGDRQITLQRPDVVRLRQFLGRIQADV